MDDSFARSHFDEARNTVISRMREAKKKIDEFALMGRTTHQDEPLSSFPLLSFVTILAYANFIRHPALRRASSGQLFRHDEACLRVAGKRRGILFHRRLSFDDLAFRSRRTPPAYS